MEKLKHFWRVVLLLAVGAFAPIAHTATSTVPDQRDGQVLQALLLHLLNDPKFDMTKAPTNGAVIVLHTRTPEMTHFLQLDQMRSDIGSYSLPNDAERDLLQRNKKANAKPDTFDAVSASFTNLVFDGSISVADITDKMANRRFGAFEKAHPTARGWVEAYLPGYSKDGNRAVVRAGVGPWAHAAMVTALIEKVGDTWVVKWHYVARYF